MSSATAKNRPPGGWRQFCSGPHRALGRTAFGRSCTRTQGARQHFSRGKATRARGPGSLFAIYPDPRGPAAFHRLPGSGSRNPAPALIRRLHGSGCRIRGAGIILLGPRSVEHAWNNSTVSRGTRVEQILAISRFPWNTRGTRSPEPEKIIPLFNSFYLSRVPGSGSFQPYAILTHTRIHGGNFHRPKKRRFKAPARTMDTDSQGFSAFTFRACKT